MQDVMTGVNENVQQHGLQEAIYVESAAWQPNDQVRETPMTPRSCNDEKILQGRAAFRLIAGPSTRQKQERGFAMYPTGSTQGSLQMDTWDIG